MTFYFIISFIQQECIKLIKVTVKTSLKDHVTLSNDAENSALHHKNKLHF